MMDVLQNLHDPRTASFFSGEELETREFRVLDLDYTADHWESWDLNFGPLTPRRSHGTSLG